MSIVVRFRCQCWPKRAWRRKSNIGRSCGRLHTRWNPNWARFAPEWAARRSSDTSDSSKNLSRHTVATIIPDKCRPGGFCCTHRFDCSRFCVVRIDSDSTSTVLASVLLLMEAAFGCDLEQIGATLALTPTRNGTQTLLVCEKATTLALCRTLCWPGTTQTLLAVWVIALYLMNKLVTQTTSDWKWMSVCNRLKLNLCGILFWSILYTVYNMNSMRFISWKFNLNRCEYSCIANLFLRWQCLHWALAVRSGARSIFRSKALSAQVGFPIQ